MRALERRSNPDKDPDKDCLGQDMTRPPRIKALDDMADKFLDSVENMGAGEKPSIAGYAELGDRIDGRAPQQVQISGDEDNPLAVTEIVRKVVPPGGAA